MRITGLLSKAAAGMALASLMLSGSRATAAAQAGAPAAECDVSETSPRELGNALLQLQSAMGDTVIASKLRKLRASVEQASLNIEKGQNIPGRNYVMAQALFVFLHLPDFNVVTTRGELGFKTAPEEPVDLVVALDSLLTAVETSNPKCADALQPYRFSEYWVGLLTQATNLLHDSQEDSAKKLVRRAQILERESPYTWQILATMSSRKLDNDSAAIYWGKTLSATGTPAAGDTAGVALRLTSLYYLGEAHLAMAADASGDARGSHADSSAKYFRQFMEEAGKHKDTPAARANLSQALLFQNDTAAVVALFADLIARPAEHGAQDHLQAGVIATGLGRKEDAVKLFTNATNAAPHDRDAMYNLAVSLFAAERFAEMTSVTSKLYSYDPNNPQNVEMLLYAYLRAREALTDDAKKAEYADTVTKYQAIHDKMIESHRVTYNIFSKGSSSTRLVGEIENLGKEAKTFTLEFDFIDSSGNVIGSGKSNPITVQAGSPARFEVTIDAGGAAGFKAKPIPLT